MTGAVTDANDGKPLAGATVKVGDVATFTTGADGTFSGRCPPALRHRGLQQAPSPRRHRRPRSPAITGGHRPDHRPGGRLSAALTVVAPAAQQRTRTVDLSNLGAATAYTSP